LKGKFMKQIGIGVIGCGNMGMYVVKGVLALNPNLKVVAVFDPDQSAMNKAQKDITPAPVACGSYNSLIQIPEVEWVMIASWNCFHSQQAIAAFQAEKHVFCQKPLATTMTECIGMLQAWKRSGALFNIGFTLRYSPHYRKIKELIATGAIGKIISMEFNETLDFNHGAFIMSDWRRLRKNAGTHLLEKCCHDIDLVNWMVGSRAKRVASFGGNNFFIPENQRLIQKEDPTEKGSAVFSWDGISNNAFTSDKDIVDNQVVILEYANGVRAGFHLNCSAGIPERRMYILGTKGAIRADVLNGEIELKRIEKDAKMENLSTSSRGGHGGGDDVLAAELAETMLHHTPPSVGLMEGLESAVTCLAIDEAMDTGKVVDVAPYWEKIKLAESPVTENALSHAKRETFNQTEIKYKAHEPMTA
jgi:predicted dehydrogenase